MDMGSCLSQSDLPKSKSFSLRNCHGTLECPVCAQHFKDILGYLDFAKIKHISDGKTGDIFIIEYEGNSANLLEHLGVKYHRYELTNDRHYFV